MHLISSLLFAFSANVDNFTVGLAYGIKKIKIGFLSNLLIACITGLGTFLSMSLGFVVSKFIPMAISNILGSIILILLGTWFLVEYFTKKDEVEGQSSKYTKDDSVGYNEIVRRPEIADVDNSGSIDIKESVALALGLTINNLGLGIGASITGLNMILTIIFTVIFSMINLAAGRKIGDSYIAKILGKYAPLISAVIIIALGIFEIVI